MEHYLHMCQSMRNTRSRLQSSPRLLAPTKAKASPNQLNNFNVSTESHTRQPPPPCLQCLCLHDLSPTSRIYINWRSTLIFLQPPPPLHLLMFELQTLNSIPPSYVSIVLISLTPAIPIVVILTYLSTRSIVHAIPLSVT